MKIHNIPLALLFQRISYPSGMVKERTCVYLAELLTTENHADAVNEILIEWLDEQSMESLCIVPLLIYIRAKETSNQFKPPLRVELEKHIKAPSILSWMLLEELYRERIAEPEWGRFHSKEIPTVFKGNEFFFKYSRGFIPPIYMDTAENIERRMRIPFVKQWEYEWKRIVDHEGIELSTGPINNMGREDDKHYVGFDTRMSEVYRSAYLRTLAWAIDFHKMPINHACLLSTKACPIDIELWRLQPSSLPEWFPKIESTTGTLDTSHGQLWSLVENLWNKRFEIEKDFVLAQTNGLVVSGDCFIDLEIYGVFQKTMGTNIPHLSEVIDWCRWKNTIDPMCKSYLRFGGILEPNNPDNSGVEFNDWLILPATLRMHPITTPRWQWWRVYRDFWVPALFLLNEEYKIDVSSNEISFTSSSKVAGRWKDWTNGLAEQALANVPPATGEYLTISRSLIQQFEEQSKYRFCWIVRATTYHRKYKYERFQTFSLEKQFGATSLIVS